MAKKTKSLTTFGLGYNSTISPRDLKDDALAKSQGISVDRPGVLSLMGKANHLSASDYKYKNNLGEGNVVDSGSLVLDKERISNSNGGPINDPGSGCFSFISEYSYGQQGLISAVANNTATATNSIKITSDASTPFSLASNANEDNTKIQLSTDMLIYIWGNSKDSPIFDLNNRYFKIIGLDEANQGISLINVKSLDIDTQGTNTVLSLDSLNNCGTTYVQGTHGGYWKTIPSLTTTRYITSQDGECIDLYYDEILSNNEFSKGWVLPGTIGLVENNDGIIGLRGATTSDDILGLDNNFIKWPSYSGVNYAVKPTFFFTDNVLRITSLNRIYRTQGHDTTSLGSPRWFGVIDRKKMFGIDSMLTNMQEWYLAESNIRPPAHNLGSFGAMVGNPVNNKLLYRYSWDTGIVRQDNSIGTETDNLITNRSIKFSFDEASSQTYKDFSGSIGMNWLKLNGEFANSENRLDVIQKSGRTNDGFVYPTFLSDNVLADGGMRFSRQDANTENNTIKLEYWHVDADLDGDHVDTSTTDWLWIKGDGGNQGYVSKTGSNTTALYCMRDLEGYQSHVTPAYQYLLSFSAEGCTDTDDSYLSVSIAGGTAFDVHLNAHSSGIGKAANNITIELVAGSNVSTNHELIKFLPSANSWVCTKLSNVKLVIKQYSSNAVTYGYNVEEQVGNSPADDELGWDNGDYTFYGTWMYDETSIKGQESTPCLLRTLDFKHTVQRHLRISPAVKFSSDGQHYDIMDKRIVGSKLYYKKNTSNEDTEESDEIYLLLEMDWNRGVKQYGGGINRWIPWTNRDLDNYPGGVDSLTLEHGTENSMGPNNDTDSVVMPKFDCTKVYFEWKEAPIGTAPYEDSNGHKYDVAGNCNAKYGTIASVNGQTYIGNIAVPTNRQVETFKKEPTYEYYPTRIIQCAPGAIDKFPLDSILKTQGLAESSIVKMYGMKNYLVVLCKASHFILDLSSGVKTLINTYANGIEHACQSLQNEHGIIWVNDKGCFQFDGQRVTDLSLGRISKDKQGWVNNNTGLHYWDVFKDKKNVPLVGYLSDRQVLIIKNSALKNGYEEEEGRIFTYNYIQKSWSTNESGKANNEGGDNRTNYSFASFESNEYMSNFANLSDGNMIFKISRADANLFYKWHNKPNSDDTENNFIFNTKDVDFGFPHNKKRVYQIYITYRCTGDSGANSEFSIDGEADSIEFRVDGEKTNYNNSFNDTEGKWAVASLISSSPINCYSIQLRVFGSNVPSDFEINDITFVYRKKNVRVDI